MRLAGFVVISMLVGSCATDAGFKTTLARWDKLRDQPGFAAYVATFVSVQTAERLDINSGCYDYDVGTTVDLIMVVESSGRIAAAYTDNESKKAKCFRKAYIGIKMPIPPFSPFPIRLKVR
jgi:hypothetical protein